MASSLRRIAVRFRSSSAGVASGAGEAVHSSPRTSGKLSGSASAASQALVAGLEASPSFGGGGLFGGIGWKNSLKLPDELYSTLPGDVRKVLSEDYMSLRQRRSVQKHRAMERYLVDENDNKGSLQARVAQVSERIKIMEETVRTSRAKKRTRSRVHLGSLLWLRHRYMKVIKRNDLEMYLRLTEEYSIRELLPYMRGDPAKELYRTDERFPRLRYPSTKSAAAHVKEYGYWLHPKHRPA